MGHKDHKVMAPRSVSCYVLTISDTRTEETDGSGRTILHLLRGAGHRIAGYSILRDEPKDIRSLIRRVSRRKDLQVIIINGGTGISSRDSTFEAVDGLLQKRLPGFGELFRWLSYRDIGSAAIMSRAVAGVFRKKIVMSVPGSSGAVSLAMRKIIIPELPHLVREVSH